MDSPVVIIANPVAHGVSLARLGEVRRLLKARGVKARLHLTARKGDAEGLAGEAAREAPRFVFAAGGDGTVNEVINGLAGTTVPMAVLPFGTMNVLARELAIPRETGGAVEAALRGRPRDVTLGRVRFRSPAGGSGLSRYFCLMAGIGYDGETVAALRPGLKARLPRTAHFLSGIKTLVSWDPGELSVVMDGARYTGYSLVVSNASRYSGDCIIAPEADITSPHFHVFLMRGRGRLDILRYALGILRGRHLGLRDIVYARAKDISVEGETRIQVDGEYIGGTPASIEAVPGALRLIY